MKRKNLGFTLAEVLIVIGIIGVVAALTLPNLNHATGDKERVTKVKKIYSTLNDAYDRAQVVYGDVAGWYNYAISQAGEDVDSDTLVNNLFINRISEFMKASKGEYSDSLTIILPDKIEFVIWPSSPNESIYYNNQIYVGDILVDLDGFNKGKNLRGHDQFKFDMTDQGIYPEGIADNKINYVFNDYAGHSKWILENDNADYLKADESGKCNDSDIVLNWTTNTSCH